jgi:hypothetical protein
MHKRLLLSLVLLLNVSAVFGSDDSCFEDCADGTKKAILCPGRLCMTTSLKDATTCTFSTWPILSSCFHPKGKCFHEWNYAVVTVLLAAGIVSAVKNESFRKKISKLTAQWKKKK